MNDVARRRLAAQGLTGGGFTGVGEAVRWLGAVQAQDYPAATWALGQRVAGARAADVNGALDDGLVLRTHVMRPTWHLVAREDMRWLMELTGPRVRAGIAGRLRQLELDPATVARAEDLIGEAVAGGSHRTRRELGELLEAAGIPIEGQRLPHLIFAAEVDLVVVSGRRTPRGEQTYALFDERVPPASLPRERAAVELATRYFRSHGPAQLRDFTWWSGLTGKDARAAVAGAGPALEMELNDGVEHWFDPSARPPPAEAPLAHLLPNFDEYLVAYRDRDAAMDPEVPFDPSLFSFESVLGNVVLVDGRVRGAWRRVATAHQVRVEVRLLAPLTPAEQAAVEAAAQAYATFVALPLALSFA